MVIRTYHIRFHDLLRGTCSKILFTYCMLLMQLYPPPPGIWSHHQQSRTRLSTLVLHFFLPKQNVPDYTPIGHTLVPIWRLLSVCGGDSSGKHTADKRLLFCKQPSDLLRLGLAPFQMGLFCIGPKLKPLRDWFPGGRFNAITVRSAQRRVVTPELSKPEGGVHAFRSKGSEGEWDGWNDVAEKILLSLAEHSENEGDNVNDQRMPLNWKNLVETE